MLMGGTKGQGKSFLMMNLARDLLRGHGYTPESGAFSCPHFAPAKSLNRIHMIEMEIGKWTIGERLERCFADCAHLLKDRFVINSGYTQGISLSDPTYCGWLKANCALEGTDLLIIDPINQYHHWDENSALHMGYLLETLREIQGNGTAVIMTHHFKKPPRSGSRDLEDYDNLDIYNFRGTRVSDDADAVWTCARRPGKVVNAIWDNWRLDNQLVLRHNSSPERFVLDVNVANQFEVAFSAPEAAPRTFA